jgi:ATP synthase protein I
MRPTQNPAGLNPSQLTPTIRGLRSKGCCVDATRRRLLAVTVAFFVPVDSPRKMGNTQTFQKARLAVFRLAGWQLALTIALVGLALLFSDTKTATSVLVGGLIGLLAGLYQSQRMLRVDAGTDPEAFMRGLWVSEAVKIVLTVALFIVAIRLLRVQMVPTIVGYAGTYMVYWAALGTRYPWFETRIESDREKNWPDA